MHWFSDCLKDLQRYNEFEFGIRSEFTAKFQVSLSIILMSCVVYLFTASLPALMMLTSKYQSTVNLYPVFIPTIQLTLIICVK